MEKYKLLIENIKQSDLSEEDKNTLISKLSDNQLDLDDFIKGFLGICSISKEILKLFGIDI
ncbi:hypothetical protein ACFSJW_04755 [Flavobacterium artemisiae]|uniref:Uncharacterized protein n=2 Tax=Flavobacterium TaxID=237 RepID=A0ABW4HJV3_9FLAO|nr:hypothetical protein [Flavobacterium humidisoli]UPZ13942.1 hypothetical protein M0M44_14400 [Flavobacterium humidisoli]